MPATTQTDLPGLLKVLSEPTRLRILALLEREELAAGELSRALGMGPSRVSNHLRILREQRLLKERQDGSRSFLRAALAVDGGADELTAAVWNSVRAGVEELPEHEADRMRLASLLEERSRTGSSFFDRVAGRWDKFGARFESGQARQRAVASLLGPGLVFADLGCGTGYFARALVGLCARLVCVDGSAGMLEEAARRLDALDPRGQGTEIDLRPGDLSSLPIATDELDGAIAGLVLHHLPEPEPALREAFRVVRPGGSLTVVELAPHRERWMLDELGDRHLGLDSGQVAHAMRTVGFVDVRLEALDDRYCPLPTQAQAEGGGTNGSSGSNGAPGAGALGSAHLPLYVVRGRVPAGDPETQPGEARPSGRDRKH